jgi:hypothetical protein
MILSISSFGTGLKAEKRIGSTPLASPSHILLPRTSCTFASNLKHSKHGSNGQHTELNRLVPIRKVLKIQPGYYFGEG